VTTHTPCRSPTPTVNSCDLTPPQWTQTSELEYSDLTTSNRRSSTPYSRNTPLSFPRGTRTYAFSWSTKHAYTSLAYSMKMCRRVKIRSVALRSGRKLHWVSFRFGSIISWHPFWRHLVRWRWAAHGDYWNRPMRLNDYWNRPMKLNEYLNRPMRLNDYCSRPMRSDSRSSIKAPLIANTKQPRRYYYFFLNLSTDEALKLLALECLLQITSTKVLPRHRRICQLKPRNKQRSRSFKVGSDRFWKRKSNARRDVTYPLHVTIWRRTKRSTPSGKSPYRKKLTPVKWSGSGGRFPRKNVRAASKFLGTVTLRPWQQSGLHGNLGCGVGGKMSDSDLSKISTPQHNMNENGFVSISNQWKSWYRSKFCFTKSFERYRIISTGIPSLGVWCKKWSNWTSGVGQKIRLLVLLGIRLHPKTSDSATVMAASSLVFFYNLLTLAKNLNDRS